MQTQDFSSVFQPVEFVLFLGDHFFNVLDIFIKLFDRKIADVPGVNAHEID